MVKKILLHRELSHCGLKKYISWDEQTAPHVVVIGATGSGKTYFCKMLLGKISIYQPDAQLYLCDFKGDDDFSFLEQTANFYRFERCKEGLQNFYQRFLNRQCRDETARNMLVMFFDEWASYCNSLDKKAIEDEKKKLSTLLMLGRSFNVHVIISQQRADAQYFNAARDNFNMVVGLGNLSEESKAMLFHEYKDLMVSDAQRGCGYMHINGTNFTSIQVPRVNSVEKLHNAILALAKR